MPRNWNSNSRYRHDGGIITPAIKHPACHAGLDPASSSILIAFAVMAALAFVIAWGQEKWLHKTGQEIYMYFKSVDIMKKEYVHLNQFMA